MKTTYRNKIGLFLFVIVFALAGCDSIESNSTEEDAPAVIPAEAFSVDLDMFGPQANKGTYESSHYIAAVWRVSVATVITGTILYYPSALTKALQEVDPVVNGDTYIWAVETTVAGRPHSAELRARLDGPAIDWEMRMTGIDDETGNYLENFVLYEATTGIVSNNGTFEIFYPKNGESLKVMDGAYDVAEDGTHTLEFSIPSNVEELGGAKAIFSNGGITNTLDLTGAEGLNHFIEWNTQTDEGALTADDYNNGTRSCWNAERQNADC